ncbi:hypothetical protein F66182_6639 [Fusarium sp. NRRL 66182]|nr:hypothetical protein F66182_6639 [Fusarium sp. NRRL 66182]
MSQEAVHQTIDVLHEQQVQLHTIQVQNLEQINALKSKLLDFDTKKQPFVKQSPQNLIQMNQFRQIRAVTSGPSQAQRMMAIHLHQRGVSKEVVARRVNYTGGAYRIGQAAAHARLATGTPVPASAAFLNRTQVEELLQFVKSSPVARRMALAAIPCELGWECTEQAVRTTLGRRGYKRYPAIVRPAINEQTRQLRLNFANKHVDWTVEQWNNVIFTADFDFLAERPQVMVTRKTDEQYDPDCIVYEATVPPSTGSGSLWFNGHFSGSNGKGPLIIWGASDRRNTGHDELRPEIYWKLFFPTLCNWLDSHPSNAQFAMQQDFPVCAQVATEDELRGRHMHVVHLPPTSNDLNPVADMFNMMKTALEADRDNSLFGEIYENRAMNVLIQTWRDISEDFMQDLMEGMSARCKAVIDADGMHIKL